MEPSAIVTGSPGHRANVNAVQPRPRVPAGDPKGGQWTTTRTARSRITNHRTMWPKLDGRSAEARRFRDLVRQFVADMGGIEDCSAVKLGLIRRLAAVTVMSEQIEARMANGDRVDVTTLCQLASTALRLSGRLGLDRRQRDVTPTLSDYLRATAHPDGEAVP